MTLHPPILFVDFDGVLHAVDEPVVFADSCLLTNPNLFCWRPFLEHALEPYPEVRIIISSGWRLNFDDTNLTLLLAGVVECRKDSRADEIRTEVKRRGITEWLAIDDHPSFAKASQRD